MLNSKSPDQRVDPEREKQLRQQLQERVRQSSQNSQPAQAASTLKEPKTHDLADRLNNRVQLTSDGHRVYLAAIESAFEIASRVQSAGDVWLWVSKVAHYRVPCPSLPCRKPRSFLQENASSRVGLGNVESLKRIAGGNYANLDA